MKALCIALALAGALSGCGLLDSRELWSSGNYVILWIDGPDDAHLAYRAGPATTMGISDPCVSAVAENAAYIAIEQRPPQSTLRPMYVIYAKRARAPGEPPAQALGEPMHREVYKTTAARLGLPALQPVGAEDVCGWEN